MAGRHGKLSNSPYHVITKRDLASEKNNDYQYKTPICKYRKNNQLCNLPQNKLRYKKICIFEKCRYLDKTDTPTRNKCAFLLKDKCSKNLFNCTADEDLAYCCDYFLPMEEYSVFHKQLEINEQYNCAYKALIDSIKSVKKKQKYCIGKIKLHKQTLLNRCIVEICNSQKLIKKNEETLLPNALNYKNVNEQKRVFQFSVKQLEKIEIEFMWFEKFIQDNQQWMILNVKEDVGKYKNGIETYMNAKEQYISAYKKLLQK